MKNFVPSILFLFIAWQVSGQNVGINNGDPQVSLDINGGLAHRGVALNPYMNAVNLPSNISFGSIEQTDVTGPVSVIDPEIWIDGRRLVLWNNTGFVAMFSDVTIEPNKAREFICKPSSGGWKPLGDGESQLEKVTENVKTGWRLRGSDPAHYGNIGINAIDLTYFDSPSSTRGATGNYSFATGFASISSGSYSTAMGFDSKASGEYSTAIGVGNVASGNFATSNGGATIARAYHSLAVGHFNDSITSANPTAWVPTDPLFYIGNGMDANSRRNALVVYKNGNTDISGFAKLGTIAEAAPSIKMKKIIDTGPAINASKNIPHGLNAAKILEIEIFMEKQMQGLPDSPTRVVPPNFTAVNGSHYQFELSDENIVIYNIGGFSIAGKNLRILITYEE